MRWLAYLRFAFTVDISLTLEGRSKLKDRERKSKKLCCRSAILRKDFAGRVLRLLVSLDGIVLAAPALPEAGNLSCMLLIEVEFTQSALCIPHY